MNTSSEMRRRQKHACTPDHALATLQTTICVTGILEAGRMSLDAGNKPFTFTYADDDSVEPTGIAAAAM